MTSSSNMLFDLSPVRASVSFSGPYTMSKVSMFGRTESSLKLSDPAGRPDMSSHSRSDTGRDDVLRALKGKGGRKKKNQLVELDRGNIRI